MLAQRVAGAYVRGSDGSWSLRDEALQCTAKGFERNDAPLAAILQPLTVDAGECSILHLLPAERNHNQLLPAGPPPKAQHGRQLASRSLSMPHRGASSCANSILSQSLPQRRPKGVERSAEDLAAAIAAAHAMLGLSPEGALAALGISPDALDSILQQRMLGRSGMQPRAKTAGIRVNSPSTGAGSQRRKAPPIGTPPLIDDQAKAVVRWSAGSHTASLHSASQHSSKTSQLSQLSRPTSSHAGSLSSHVCSQGYLPCVWLP